MNFVTFDAEPGPGEGFVVVEREGFSAGDMIIYVQTDDIEASLAQAEKLGSKTLPPKTEIPGTGWFAFFADPGGNRIGLFSGTGGWAILDHKPLNPFSHGSMAGSHPSTIFPSHLASFRPGSRRS
jgi:hypothetical protein